MNNKSKEIELLPKLNFATSRHAQYPNSGAAGNAFGRATAPLVAESIGATMLGSSSNEARFRGKPVVIKSARVQTQSIGVTYSTLNRVDFIIGAFQQNDGAFSVYGMPVDAFRARMRGTRSKGASAGRVGQLAKSVFISEGEMLAY